MERQRNLRLLNPNERKSRRRKKTISSTEYWIVGLGNPGQSYQFTRHNVGFLAIDGFVEKYSIVGREYQRWSSRVIKAAYEEKTLCLVKPQTMMNNSGQTVREIRHDQGNLLTLNRFLVVCDDFYLALGDIRLRSKGSSGGHHGLESVEMALETTEYVRLRVGVGPCIGEAARFVLSPFKKEERSLLEVVLNQTVETIKLWIDQGIGKAMQEVNRKKIV